MNTKRQTPDEPHRRVEPRSAPEASESALLSEGQPAPAWFGALREQARRVERHDMEAIRESVARGIELEREQEKRHG